MSSQRPSRRNSWANERPDSLGCESGYAPGYLFPLHLLGEVDQQARRMDTAHLGPLVPFASGSNSELFKGELFNRPIVVKMVSEAESVDELALLEFDTELELLQRCSHPNILGLLGAGDVPRRFLVLEYLSGGTLSERLLQHSSVTERTLNRVRPNLYETLKIGIQLADALDYLHYRFHPQACIIHRDVKPENIGFSSSGSIVLFDFGLSACVRRFHHSHSKYEMSGGTGSLRYMAPEVALGMAYNHKVDVYSYAILMWQTATGKIPFNGASKHDYMKYVVHGGIRPPLFQLWPELFNSTLSRAWDSNADIRPEFSEILSSFKNLIPA